MSPISGLGDYDLAQAFRTIDARLEGLSTAQRGPLLNLRRRLAGELVFNADEVAATLAPDFELVTRADTASTVTSGTAMVSGIRSRGQTGGSLMWVELDDLLIDAAIAGHGVLRMMSPGEENLRPGDLRVTSFAFAMFLAFDGDLMKSETLFMDGAAAEVATLRDVSIPSAADLLDMVARGDMW